MNYKRFMRFMPNERKEQLQKVIDKYNTLDVTYDQLMETEGFAEISSQQYIDNLDYYHQWMEYFHSTVTRTFHYSCSCTDADI